MGMHASLQFQVYPCHLAVYIAGSAGETSFRHYSTYSSLSSLQDTCAAMRVSTDIVTNSHPTGCIRIANNSQGMILA